MRARANFFASRLFVAATALVVAAGCAINPATGKPQLILMSEAREAQLGREAADQVIQEMGLVDDPQLAAYVGAVGERLVRVSVRPDQHFEFHVVDMQEPNAFALPGGYVYVSRGLLAISNSEDELANVLGHEIGHVLARHAAQRETRALPGSFLTGLTALAAGIVGGSQAAALVGSIGQTATSGLLAAYSRDQEQEADKLGQELAARAGYGPAGMTAFLTTLERETTYEAKGSRRASFFDSHPSTPERVSTTETFAGELATSPGKPLAPSRAAFLEKLDGLVLGADARQGIFEETTFLHPELAFHIRFPEEWKTSNGRTAVGAVSPTQDAVVALEFEGRGTDPRAAAEAFVAAQRIDVSQSGALLVSGLEAFRVLGVAQTQGGGVPVLLSFIAYREGIYRVTGLARASVFKERAPEFEKTAESFGALSPAERARILQRRLRLAKALAGETIEELGARVRNVWSPEQIAIANALEPGTRLEGGRLVKFAREEPLSTSSKGTRGEDGPGPLGDAADGARRPTGNR
ncbi:MAG TPA: M48 family metalloprotease [Myxococcota bacterium]|nr:M48 family metalloprotease [Myxococcota bacterium]